MNDPIDASLERLRIAYSELNQIFNTSGDAMRVIAPDQRVVRANEAFLSLVGLSREEVVDSRCCEHFFGGVCNTGACPLQRIARGEARYEAELEKRLPDGRTITCVVTATPWRDEDGRLLGVVENIKDVTARREAEEQLREAAQMEALGRLLAGVAHEVRNPLNAITALAAALSRGLGDTGDQAEYLRHIRAQVDRLSTLMNDLLEYGKPVREGSICHLSAADLAAGAIDLARAATEAAGPTIDLSIESEAEGATIRGERSRLERALVNVIENAVEHTPPGEAVAVVLRADPASVTIVVSDAGTGIAEEDLPRVFDPFFTRRKGGTGLGLSIVRSIVHAHDGDATMYNGGPGRGAIVELRLPRDDGGER